MSIASIKPEMTQVQKKSGYKRPIKAKGRPSLTPGTVVILLTGQLRGRKAVVLKSLPSGALVVSGPQELSGVSLRKVMPTYVIATSVKVDLGGVSTTDLDNALLSKRQASEDVTKAALEPLQKRIDGQLMSKVQAFDPLLPGYLKTPFSLQRGQAPHSMKF